MRSYKLCFFILFFGCVIIFTGCSTRPPKPINERMLLDLHTNTMSVIPDECYDDNGEFDPDLGHDTLDCDNL
jgi:hypothetical protein